MRKPPLEKHPQYRQLLRLQELRSQLSEARYREAQSVLLDAQKVQREREKSVAHHQKGIDRLNENYRSSVPKGEDIKRCFAREREYWVNYDLERDQYYLQMDIEEVESATQAVAKAWAELSRARAKEDASRERVADCHYRLREREDTHAEAEVEEMYMQNKG